MAFSFGFTDLSPIKGIGVSGKSGNVRMEMNAVLPGLAAKWTDFPVRTLEQRLQIIFTEFNVLENVH